MAKIIGKWAAKQVFIDGRELFPVSSQQVYNHSPEGFNWGYGGSGAAQLALALLLEYIPVETATRWYQDFKWEIIAKIPQGDFSMDDAVIKGWLIMKGAL